MELRHLRYFVMAAEERNISRAASRLSVSQPAVSRQIRDLEEELGAALFERKSQGLILTDAGETALTHAREVLRQSKAMTDALQAFGSNSKTISLKIGFIPTALPGFLAGGLREFNQTHPDVSVQIFEMNPSEQEKALREGKIDLALLGNACPELKKTYEVEAIRKVPMALALPDDHPLAGRKSLDLAELADDTFLSLDERHFPGRPELLEELFGKAKIAPQVSMKASGLSELLGLVGSGTGVALIPADVVQLPHSGVVFIELKRPKITLISSAVWRKNEPGQEIPNLVELLQDRPR
ncbi:MAG: LysR family transcriptional regulator [Verrucomicrobiota bacterium]